MEMVKNETWDGYFANERVRYPCTVVHRLTTHDYNEGRIKTLVLVLVDGELNVDDMYRPFFLSVDTLRGLEFVINEMSQDGPQVTVEATSFRSRKPMLFHADTQKTPEPTNTYNSKPRSEQFKQHLKHIVGDDDHNEPYKHSEADLALAKHKLKRHEAKLAREAKRKQERRFCVGDRVKLSVLGLDFCDNMLDGIADKQWLKTNEFIYPLEKCLKERLFRANSKG